MRASDLRRRVKTAFLSPDLMPQWARTRPLLGIAAGAGALAMGGSAAHGAWEGAEYGLRKGFGAAGKKIRESRGYKRMLEENEDMEDTPEARRAYSTMHSFAPSVAKDPMVAGTFVKRVNRFGEDVDANWVKTLVDIESRHNPGYQSSGMGNLFAQNFARGLQMGSEGLTRGDQFTRQETDRRRSLTQKDTELASKAQAAQDSAANARARIALEHMLGPKGAPGTPSGKDRLQSDPAVQARVQRAIRTELDKMAQSQVQLDHMRVLRHKLARGR